MALRKEREDLASKAADATKRAAELDVAAAESAKRIADLDQELAAAIKRVSDLDGKCAMLLKSLCLSYPCIYSAFLGSLARMVLMVTKFWWVFSVLGIQCPKRHGLIIFEFVISSAEQLASPITEMSVLDDE